ncbi:MAG: site-2 protease family protein, partial [Candidatus Micrarchaeota archaeon]
MPMMPAIGGKTFFLFFISLFVGGYGFFMLAQLGYGAAKVILDIMSGVNATPLLQPVIPGVDIPGAPIKIPLVAIISFVILIIVHEFSHGIVALYEKLRLKALGLITIGVFPIGAFAEPDEKQLEKTTAQKRMRVYTAGSMANFATAFIFLIALIGVSAYTNPYLTDHSYQKVAEVDVGSPSQLAGMAVGMGVISYETNGRYFYFETVEKGPMTVVANSTGQIGMSLGAEIYPYNTDSGTFWAAYYGTDAIRWTYLLNFLVGMFNFMPFLIFDGARVLQDIADDFFRRLGLRVKNAGKKTVLACSIFITALLIINFAAYVV